MISRRHFLALSALVSSSAMSGSVQKEQWPEPELQQPGSARGRRLAEIARTVRATRNVSFLRRPQRTLRLDVYVPAEKPRRPLPAILRFGVAAWQSQSKNFRMNLDQLLPAPTPNLFPPALVPEGFIVVSAECRVASEARFPAQIHDCKCAVRWMRAHAKEFRIDPDRIGVMGASSSGHLAALVAVTDQGDKLEDDSCYPGHSSRVQAAYCFAGLYDFELYESHLGDGTLQPQVRNFLGGTFEEIPEVYRHASPRTYVTSDDPPFLLMHGMQDRRVPYDQSPHFVEVLSKAGVAVEFISINNYEHGPAPGKQSSPSYEALDEKIFRFFHKFLS